MEEKAVVEQTPEERIADKIFGPEEPSEDEGFSLPEESEEPEEEPEEAVEEPEEEPEEARFVEIEIDGELLEVPERYKDYFLRQQDYTTKTQEVANQRKEVELQQAELQQTRQRFEFAQSIQDDVLKAQALESQANQYHDYLRQNIDSLSSTDIEKLRMAIEDSRRERDQIVQSVQGRQAEFQQAQEQSHAELLNKGTEILKQRIPGWGEEQQKQVRDFAVSQGFSEQELNTVYDPRYVEVLYKASQYDALKSGAAPAVKRVKEAPTIKPKSRNPMPDDVKKKLKLRKQLQSGKSAADKADLIREDIADRLGL